MIFRIPVGIPIVYGICVSENSPIFMKFVSFCILLQSLKWSYTMFNILQKRYEEMLWRQERKIELAWFTPNPQMQKMQDEKKKKE